MNDALIRPARSEECASLSTLAQRSKAYWGYDEVFMEACRGELTITPAFLLDHPTHLRSLRGRTVGFYSLEALSSSHVELCHLFVAPETMGQGHGRALLDHARVWARAAGYRVMAIQADPNAADFYLRCGARWVGERPSESIARRYLPSFEIAL